MPDIDKINLVSVDSIEKLNSILKANIASINGMVVVSGVGEPAAAYSMRLLGEEVGISSYTGPAIRVRRTGDDVEADVAFDSGEITLNSAISNTTASETTFGDFVGHGGTPVDAFVDTWYDQSSNANHAEQATPGSQPQIYDATNGLITENGKPAVDFNSNFLTSGSITSTGDQSFSFVTKADTTAQTGVLASSFQRALFIASGTATYQSNQGIENDKDYGSYTASQMLHFVYHDNTTTANSFGRIDTVQNSLDPSVNDKWDDVVLGRYDATSSLDYNGNIQEFIFWTNDQSGNVSGIEIDTNDYFLIDNLPSPTSGLLGTYTGAAAAYSVRKLANTASKSMRILVDSDANGPDGSDPTYDIGFNADGRLDVAAIEAYCNNPSGTNYDAYVVTWYDQSGEGNHATQSTFTSCPKIADAGVVITENGKPMLTGGFMFIGISNIGDTSIFSVAKGPNTGQRSVSISNAGNLPYWGYAQESTGTSASNTVTNYVNGSVLAASTTRQQLFDAMNSIQSLLTMFGSMSSVNNFTLGFNHLLDMHDSQEFILWQSDQTSPTNNRPAIESNINSEYLIYQPTDQPTSGFLYDYGSQSGGTDAAAAYSVRQLSDKAVIAMTIRRDMGTGNPGDDDETNIGWDANGDLDTQAIADFCGTGTGWVTRWWDQSVNGNHADQDAQGSQPQIYNGTAVITENGKPAIEFIGGAGVSPTNRHHFITNSYIVELSQNNASVFVTSAQSSIGVESYLLAEADSVSPYSSNFIFGGGGGGPVLWVNATTFGSMVTGQSLAGFDYDGTNFQAYTNGSTNGSSGSATVNTETGSYTYIGCRADAVQDFLVGKVQEIISYKSDQSSNRTGIETDINSYFQVYT